MNVVIGSCCKVIKNEFKESLRCDIYLNNFKLLVGMCYQIPKTTQVFMKQLEKPAEYQL